MGGSCVVLAESTYQNHKHRVCQRKCGCLVTGLRSKRCFGPVYSCHYIKGWSNWDMAVRGF